MEPDLLSLVLENSSILTEAKNTSGSLVDGRVGIMMEIDARDRFRETCISAEGYREGMNQRN